MEPLAWKESLSYCSGGARIGYQVRLGSLMWIAVRQDQGVRWRVEISAGLLSRGSALGELAPDGSFETVEEAMAAGQRAAAALLNEATEDVCRMLVEPPPRSRRRAVTQEIPVVHPEGQGDAATK